MVRTDGKYQIYRIQHRQTDGEWKYSSFDHFGTPAGMGASDACWQETGVLGTYDAETARKGLLWLRKRHPGATFRMVMVQIMQMTWPVDIDSSGAMVLSAETAP
jgi:hypothetical protein